MKATALSIALAALVILTTSTGAWAWPAPGTIQPWDSGVIVYTANGFQYTMNVLNSGTKPSATLTGTAGWIVADFEGGITGNAGTVTLTLSAPHLTGSEDVKEWLFNVTSTSGLSISSGTASGGDGMDKPTISIGSNSYALSAATGSFDIDMAFSDKPNSKFNFNGGESIQFSITKTGLTAADFLVESYITGTEKCYHTIALIDNTGTGSQTALVTPEPATLSLLGVGSLIAMRLRRRKA